MSLVQTYTNIKDQVRQLEVKFSFEILRQSKHTTLPIDFNCLVESRVWCADGVILGLSHKQSVATMRTLKNSSIFYWERKHCIDSLLHKQNPLRLYKDFRQPAAKSACKKLNDRIAALIAPSQRIWIQHHNLAAAMMKSATEFCVAHYVMNM